jgi:hypothetical protein
MMLANPRGIEGMIRLSRFVDTNSSLMSEPYAWMRWVVASLRIHLLRRRRCRTGSGGLSWG